MTGPSGYDVTRDVPAEDGDAVLFVPAEGEYTATVWQLRGALPGAIGVAATAAVSWDGLHPGFTDRPVFQSAAGLPLAVITNPDPDAGAGTSNTVLSADRRDMTHLELDFESDGWSATYKFDSAGQQRPYRAGVKGGHRSQPGTTTDAGYSRGASVLASAITSVSLPRRSPGLPPGPSSTPAVGAWCPDLRPRCASSARC